MYGITGMNRTEAEMLYLFATAGMTVLMGDQPAAMKALEGVIELRKTSSEVTALGEKMIALSRQLRSQDN